MGALTRLNALVNAPIALLWFRVCAHLKPFLKQYAGRVELDAFGPTQDRTGRIWLGPGPLSIGLNGKMWFQTELDALAQNVTPRVSNKVPLDVGSDLLCLLETQLLFNESQRLSSARGLGTKPGIKHGCQRPVVDGNTRRLYPKRECT